MRARLARYQERAIHNPFDHFTFYGGVGCGKTFTGAHFALNMIEQHPDKSGFIGANNYDQLSQVALKEFFYWLNEYGYEYVADQKPPPSWGIHQKKFKNYKNIICVKVRSYVVHIFTRVLSDPNAIRGMEFSWYWIDESRDTTMYAHDMVLARMRETEFAKGLITTTTNGEDWTYERFIKGSRQGDKSFGSMHVPTYTAVQLGILTEKYYNTLRKAYSPMMALQELDARHVNIHGGRAYYAADDRHKRVVAPWGDTHPNPDRPIIIGCDFNFQPAPCVWMVGQIGPNETGPNGQFWGECIHWFTEISDTQVGTREMSRKLMRQFPGFIYRVFGDMSGNQGTTSNAGETDFAQMAQEFSENGVIASIDAIQLDEDETKRNPYVRDRVENMNTMLMNGLGEVRMTYNQNNCPLFDLDMKMVGWKPNVSQRGRGKLDDGGDNRRTHASDGAGYAVYKLFPPYRRGFLVGSVESVSRREHGLLRD